MTEAVNVVWLQGHLSELARMSLASYLHFGYRVELWTYGVAGEIPPGVRLSDASMLMSWDHVRRRRFESTDQYALACDELSWIISYEHGGWMGHLDVTLRKPLPGGDYVFGRHHRCQVSLALWKAPAESKLAWSALENATDLPLPHRDWHAMMRAFGNAVEDCALMHHVLPDLVNDDASEDPILALTKAGSALPPEWERLNAIHWMGSGRIRHTTPEPGSYYDRVRKDLLG